MKAQLGFNAAALETLHYRPNEALCQGMGTCHQHPPPAPSAALTAFREPPGLEEAQGEHPWVYKHYIQVFFLVALAVCCMNRCSGLGPSGLSLNPFLGCVWDQLLPRPRCCPE